MLRPAALLLTLGCATVSLPGPVSAPPKDRIVEDAKILEDGGLCSDRLFVILDGPPRYKRDVLDAISWWNGYMPRTVLRWGGRHTQARRNSDREINSRRVYVKIVHDEGLLWQGACGLTYTYSIAQDEERGICTLQQGVVINVANSCIYGDGGALRIIIHELGHVLGLGHVDDRSTIMQRTVGTTNWASLDEDQFIWLQEWYK